MAQESDNVTLNSIKRKQHRHRIEKNIYFLISWHEESKARSGRAPERFFSH